MPPSAHHRLRIFTPLVLLGLLGWVLLLRWPSLGATLWNVDEAIHAAVARSLLDGGTLYRDAIDQRTPLTYGLFAAAFAVFGDNNLYAVRLALAVLVAATAFGVHLVGRRTRDTATGVFAALVFAALSTNLLPASDAFAAHTEWAVIAFTTAGAWWFWRGNSRPGLGLGFGTGALFALAFLSKQPSLLDFAAPVATSVWLAANGTWKRRDGTLTLAGLLLGFATTVGATALWFASRGALGDAVFYTWTYNLTYYGPEIGWLDRAASGLGPLRLLLREYPLVLGAGLGSAALLLVRLAQLAPSPALKRANGWHCYLLVWAGAALAGAASSGRGFEHYTIQCLPPFALAAGLALGELSTAARRLWTGSHRARATLLALPVAAVLGSTLRHPLAALEPPLPPPDPALRASAFIGERTSPDEPLFVWGYNPDIHLYSNRKPAARFVYCSFLTGLIPWTNLDPQKDTAYAIVPGAMAQLLADLERSRPPFVVDCSPGPHRNFHKYPITNFAALQSLLDRDYAVVDAGRFVPQGFRLHLIRDHARRAPLPLAGGPAVAAPSPPRLTGRADVGAEATTYTVECAAEDGRLQRLELLVDDTVVDGVSMLPCEGLSAALTAPFGTLPPGRHVVAARATRADGSSTLSAPIVVFSSAEGLPPESLAAFRIPVIARAALPLSIRAPFGPTARREGDSTVYAVHVPSSMAFPLPEHARRLTGAFGIRPGAFANQGAGTDGAGFHIRLVAPDGARSPLLDRLLRPAEVEGDRPLQRFSIDLPPAPPGSRLEFTTDPGPADNSAYDWTIWTDLAIDCTE